MSEQKRYGQYDLTTNELLKEIQKTDKEIAKFKKALKELRTHKDKSNSAELEQIIEALKDIELEGGED